MIPARVLWIQEQNRPVGVREGVFERSFWKCDCLAMAELGDQITCGENGIVLLDQ
jgi:hypothetical protein